MNKSGRFVLLGLAGLVFVSTFGLTGGVAVGQAAPPRSSIGGGSSGQSSSGQSSSGEASSGQSSSGQSSQQGEQGDLVIANEAQLPDGFPRVAYEFRFRAHGGVPTLHWQVTACCTGRPSDPASFSLRWRRSMEESRSRRCRKTSPCG